MKHLAVGLVAGGLTALVACALLLVAMAGPLAWAIAGLALGVTILVAIIDWKTEERS